jgi:hypothetical protein
VIEFYNTLGQKYPIYESNECQKLLRPISHPNFKICQKFKINQPKVINCFALGGFCLANFKFSTDFKF